MARDLTVKARIVAEDDASATIGRVQGRFARLGSFLASRFVITLGDVTSAFRLFVDGLRFAVTEAAEAERGLVRLGASLERFGPLAERVKSELLAQAEALAQTSKATDDEVVAVQTLVANLGAAPDQIARVTQAAADLSAAFGVDFEQAATALTRSLQGNGRQLAQLVPQVRGLEEAALRAGEGLKVVEERFSGRAVAELNTFTGAVGELKEALGELAEAAGTPIANSDFLTAAIRNMTAALRELATEGAEGRSFFSNFISGAIPLLGILSELAGRTREAGTAADEHGAAVNRNALLLAAWQHGLSGAAAGLDALAAAEVRAAEAAARDIEQRDLLVSKLSAVGVTLRDFDAELRANQEALILLDNAYRQGVVSVSAYQLALAQLEAAHARIRAEMQAAATGAHELASANDQAAASSRTFDAAQKPLIATLANVESRLRSATAAAIQYQLVLARSARSQAFVDAAVAAGMQPTLGGTRIRGARGGSRLVHGVRNDSFALQ